MRPAITVLQLDTNFPRVPGDVGCPATYIADVEILRIPQATVGQVVGDRPDLIDIAPFADAIHRAKGEVIVTSCGFLSFWQETLAALTDRPFISSSLTALDWLARDHDPAEVLIVTFDADSLIAAHLGQHSAFAQSIVGLPRDSHLRQVIEDDLSRLNSDLARAEMVALIARHLKPAHRHVLLECTNLPPYKSALIDVGKRPVTDILTEIERHRPGTIVPDFAARGPQT